MHRDNGQAMYAEERQQTIVERARSAGRVEVRSLAATFGVTSETIRRDLGVLERRGVLRRTHGGAVPVERLRFEPEVGERLEIMAEEKSRIARAARRFLPTRGSVLLDSGTTTSALAELLPAGRENGREAGRELTVVTNCLPIASLLAPHPALSVLISGGRVRGTTLAAVDSLAARFLEDFTPDVAFVAANGVSLGRGLTTPDPAEAAAKRAMVRNSRQVILLADHTKVGQEHFVRFAEVGELDAFITDAGLGEEAAREFEAAGVEVMRA